MNYAYPFTLEKHISHQIVQNVFILMGISLKSTTSLLTKIGTTTVFNRKSGMIEKNKLIVMKED